MTWATSLSILVFLGLSVFELGPVYATDRRQTKASLNASALWGRRHNEVLKPKVVSGLISSPLFQSLTRWTLNFIGTYCSGLKSKIKVNWGVNLQMFCDAQTC